MMYLVAIHRPNGYDGSVSEDEAMHQLIDDLNRDMQAAGVRYFAGGLQSPSLAKSLREEVDGEILVTDGPYLETKEHIGGFWLLETDSIEDAVAWGRRAVVACKAPVEVRPFF